MRRHGFRINPWVKKLLLDHSPALQVKAFPMIRWFRSYYVNTACLDLGSGHVEVPPLSIFGLLHMNHARGRFYRNYISEQVFLFFSPVGLHGLTNSILMIVTNHQVWRDHHTINRRGGAPTVISHLNTREEQEMGFFDATAGNTSWKTVLDSFVSKYSPDTEYCRILDCRELIGKQVIIDVETGSYGGSWKITIWPKTWCERQEGFASTQSNLWLSYLPFFPFLTFLRGN